MMDLVSALFDSLSCTASFTDFCGKAKAGAPSPHIARLKGKRVCIISEIAKGSVMNLALFKILASNEKIQGLLI